MLRNWLEKLIYKWALKNFTVDNLKLIIDRCLAYLKVQAAETENVVDDWAIEVLETILNDNSKLQVIYDWINQFIQPCQDGVCRASAPSPAQYDELALAVMNAGETSTTCKAVPPSVILAVLQMFVPVIVRYWRSVEQEK